MVITYKQHLILAQQTTKLKGVKHTNIKLAEQYLK